MLFSTKPPPVALKGTDKHATHKVVQECASPAPVLTLLDMGVRCRHQTLYSRYLKWPIESLHCLALGIFVLPVFLFAMAAVAWEQKSLRKVFFCQIRLGRKAIPFKIYKLRTMVMDAEKEGACFSAGKNDPRITKVGKLLRKYRIDELPQLWNVLRGEMALIGPRPERPEFNDGIVKTVPGFSMRLLLKPGITGLAQVKAGYIGTDMDGHVRKLRYDIQYLETVSAWSDFLILAQTVRTVLSGQGQ